MMIPLHVDTPTPIPLTVREEFVDYDVPEYTGAYSVTPSSSAQTLPTNGMLMTDDVTVDAVPSGNLKIPSGTYRENLLIGYLDIAYGVDTAGYLPLSSQTYPIQLMNVLPTENPKTVTPTTSEQVAVMQNKWTKGQIKVGAIPSQYIVPTGTKSITANTSSVDVKTYEFASVNVPNTYAAGDEGKVVSNGALVAQTSDTVTTNDTYDTTLINSLTVNVSGGGGLTLESALDGVIAGTITSYENPTRTTLVDSMFRANFWNKITTFKAHAVTTTQNYSMYGIGAKNVAFPNLTTLNAAFNSCAKIEKLDIGAGVSQIVANAFNAANNLNTLILRRSSSIVALAATSAFSNNHYKNGGSGGTIYIPKALYDHLGDNSSLDYKKATNWITVNGYGTITWEKIEGSIYETQYVDGTPIS